jgi:hypothetical protein
MAIIIALYASILGLAVYQDEKNNNRCQSC